MMADDVLKSRFRPGPVAFVLAPGPNGVEHWNKIPENSFVIAVNQAIEIKEVNKTIWLAADETLPEKKWFDIAAKELIASDYPLKEMNHPTPVFDSGKLYAHYPDVRWTFVHGRSLAKPPWGCISGVLRGGATISAQAIQLAYHLGCSRIYLCGVDMMGRHYFNGTEIDNNQIPENSQYENWLALNWLNILIKWLKEHKCGVYSMSRTALNVRMVNKICLD